MKLADKAIRIGVIAKLNPLLTIPIRDMEARPSDVPPFVLLSSQTDSQEPLKTEFGHESTLLIQIYSSQSLTVNRGVVDDIANTILEALIPMDTDNYISVTGFQVITVGLDSINDDTIPYGDGTLTTRKLLRIRFLLKEI